MEFIFVCFGCDNCYYIYDHVVDTFKWSPKMCKRKKKIADHTSRRMTTCVRLNKCDHYNSSKECSWSSNPYFQSIFAERTLSVYYGNSAPKANKQSETVFANICWEYNYFKAHCTVAERDSALYSIMIPRTGSVRNRCLTFFSSRLFAAQRYLDIYLPLCAPSLGIFAARTRVGMSDLAEYLFAI